jgi:hypothetical protein
MSFSHHTVAHNRLSESLHAHTHTHTHIRLQINYKYTFQSTHLELLEIIPGVGEHFYVTHVQKVFSKFQTFILMYLNHFFLLNGSGNLVLVCLKFEPLYFSSKIINKINCDYLFI